MWVKIDDQFYDHPRWADAPGDSIAMWVCAVAWCNRNNVETGKIPAVKLRALGNVRAPRTTISDLVARGAIEKAGEHYTLVNYGEYQDYEKVRSIREKRSELGKLGASKRWQTPPETDDGNSHSNSYSKRMANGDGKTMPRTPYPVEVITSHNNNNSENTPTESSSSSETSIAQQTAAAIRDATTAVIARKPTGTIRDINSYRRSITRNLTDEHATPLAAAIAAGQPAADYLATAGICTRVELAAARHTNTGYL